MLSPTVADVTAPRLDRQVRIILGALAVVAIVVVTAVVLRGGDSTETVNVGETSDTQATRTPNADPTAPVAVATSTPLPTVTPLPTSTAEPLEAPTPSTVLLTTAFTNSSKVTTVGIDEVFFGMTPDAAAEAASTTWVELPTSSGTCYRVTPASGPEGITLWVVDGHVERLDIEHPDLRTPSQLGLGNTAAELQGQLGERLTIEPTGDGGQTATFAPTDPGDRDFRIIFELEEDVVVRYRSGRIGVIDRSPAGC